MSTKRPDQIPQPNWQPLSMLPLLKGVIYDSVVDSENLYRLLQEGREKPHVLDDMLLDRVMAQTLEAKDFSWVYSEQCHKWREKNPTKAQLETIALLEARIVRWKTVIDQVCKLAEEIRASNIDRILEKSDIELGVESLLQNFSK